MNYGTFLKDWTEYEVLTPKPAHVIDNYLWNERLFSHVTQTGLGYLWYDHKGTEITQLTPGGQCETAYDKFYCRLIYLRDNETGRYWNLNWEPVLAEVKDFSCVHGLGYSRLRAEKEGIRAEMTIFIPPGKDAVEVWQLELESKGAKLRDISVFTYNEISLRSVDTYGERIYLHGEFDSSLNGIVTVKRAETLPHDHFTSFFVSDRKVGRYDCSQASFLGAGGMLNRPLVVVKGRCGNSPASCEVPVTVLQHRLKIKAGRKTPINYLLGLARDRQMAKRYIKRYFEKDGIVKAFRRLEKRNQKLIQSNRVDSPDEKLNMLMNIWNKQQIEYGAVWSRWGLRGYRDVVQHAMSMTFFDAARARETLVKAMGYLYRNGRALRSWCPIDDRAYADNALWLVFAVAKYLCETGDLSLLKEKIVFFDEGVGSGYDHLTAAVDFSWNNRGRHGLCLIKFGDWNDSLTQVGKAGRGESTWLTMALARATMEVGRIAELMKDVKRAKEYRRRHQVLKKAINEQAWETDRYIRAFDDEGRAIGSEKNQQGQLYLNTQSWGVLGYVADRERFDKSLAAIDKQLLTELGYLLLFPCYKRYYSNIGRISNMEPGVAENGTVYSHGNAFIMLACLQEGLADKAYEIYRRIAPAYHEADQEKVGVVPYMFANGFLGPEHCSRPFLSEYSWVTGSVAWFYLNVLEWMFGLRSDYEGLLIDPCLPSEWKKCRVEREFRGRRFDVCFERVDGVPLGTKKIVFNGKELSGNLIRLDESRKINRVKVYLPL